MKRARASKRLRYADYVASLLERKLATGKLATPSSRRGWIDTQQLHLLPEFGDCYLDSIKRIDIEEWKAAQAQSLVTRHGVTKTKTGRRLRIPLPHDLLAILTWHVEQLPVGVMRDSELLFPSTTGRWRSPTCLDKPIRRIAKAAGIKKHLSAKFMRRGCSRSRGPRDQRPHHPADAGPLQQRRAHRGA